MSASSGNSTDKFLRNFNHLNTFYKLFGMNALRYSYKNGRVCYNISYFLILHSITLSVFYVYVLYIQLTDWYPKGPTILIILYVHMVTASTVMTISVIGTGIYNSFAFRKLMNSQKFSHIVARARSHRKVILETIKQFCLSFTICIVCYICDLLAYVRHYTLQSTLKVLSYFIFPIYNFLSLSQFYITLFWLQCLYSDLNQELSQVAHKKNEEYYYWKFVIKNSISHRIYHRSPEHTAVSNDIRTFRGIYQHLYESSIWINKIHSTRNLLLICHHCIMSILYLYWAVRHTIPQTALPLIMLLNLYRCSLTSLISIVWIIWRSDKTMSEAHKTVLLVQELLLSTSLTKSETEELQIFSMQLLQEKLVFSPFGFFTLSNQTLLSIIGTMASYLVILFQYDGMYTVMTPGLNNSTNFDDV